MNSQTLLDQLEAANEQLRAEVAERTRAEQDALVSEQRLTLALDIVNMGTWDWDIPTDTIVWSDNVEQIHGLEPDSFNATYESWLKLLHPDDHDRVTALVSAALSDGLGRYDAKLRICLPTAR